MSVFFVYSILFLFISLSINNKLISIEIKESEEKLDMLQNPEKTAEEKAEKQFKLHQYEISKYYDQALIHNKYIFVFGIIFALLGFVIIFISIFFNNESTNELLSIIGVFSGILSNFIGVIFMQMFSKTVKSLNDFHNRLVYTHHLHYCNMLISKITDAELREKTLSDLSIIMAKNKITDIKD